MGTFSNVGRKSVDEARDEKRAGTAAYRNQDYTPAQPTHTHIPRRQSLTNPRRSPRNPALANGKEREHADSAGARPGLRVPRSIDHFELRSSRLGPIRTSSRAESINHALLIGCDLGSLGGGPD